MRVPQGEGVPRYRRGRWNPFGSKHSHQPGILNASRVKGRSRSKGADRRSFIRTHRLRRSSRTANFRIIDPSNTVFLGCRTSTLHYETAFNMRLFLVSTTLHYSPLNITAEW